MPRRRTSRAERERRVAEQVRAEREEEMKTRTLPLRTGGDSLHTTGRERNPLDDEASGILAADRRGGAGEASSHYLSREQYVLRRGKEVFNQTGTPDSSIVRGIYKRSYNPEFGHRPGKGRAGSDDG